MAQAIPRMRELSKVGHPNSVLSISPPRFVVGELKERIFWLKTKQNKKIIEKTHVITILSKIWSELIFVAPQDLHKSLRFLIEKLKLGPSEKGTKFEKNLPL